MSFEDKMMECRDCGNAFPFTAGEQEFYAQKGFTNEPQRCRDCRQSRKQQRTTPGSGQSTDRSTLRSEEMPRSTDHRRDDAPMGNSYGNERSSYGNERSSYGNERSSYGNERNSYGTGGYGSEPRRERVQHDAVCAQCGRPTVVPFVPRAGRPVYCQECFAQQRDSMPSRGPSRDRSANRY